MRPCVAGTEYLLLGGQHITKALSEVAKELEEQHLPVPDFYRQVRARVLRVDAPPAIRELAAGEHQFQQQQVKGLKLSDFARLLLKPHTQSLPTELQRLAHVLCVTGYAERVEQAVCVRCPARPPAPWLGRNAKWQTDPVPPSVLSFPLFSRGCAKRKPPRQSVCRHIAPELSVGSFQPPPQPLFPSRQEKAYKEWGPFLRFVEEGGEAALTGLVKLETNGERPTVVSLRTALRPLITPESRAAILPAFNAQNARLRTVNIASHGIQLDMYVDWHWSRENSCINQDWGVRCCPGILGSLPSPSECVGVAMGAGPRRSLWVGA